MSLLKYRNRLKTVKSLNSIFTALQVVTMVRTQKIKEKYFAMERYLIPIREVLRGRVPAEPLEKKALIVITSSRGLCGNFNNLVIKKANQYLKDNPACQLMVLGKTGTDFYKKRKSPILFSSSDSMEKPSFAGIQRLIPQLMAFNCELYAVYNAYRSTMIQVPTIVKLYPLPEELVPDSEPADYLLEPDPATLVNKLYRHYLEARLFQIILNSVMGELGARFMVLKGAVDTSKDMVTDLTLSINKARQTVITRDLLEIVSAAEALRRDYE
jgi:F-type H+-transporting ATPase subunit gamma